MNINYLQKKIFMNQYLSFEFGVFEVDITLEDGVREWLGSVDIKNL